MKLLPALLVLAVTLAQIYLGLGATDGHFIYTLDDPYIHLTLADHLWRTGVYGVNAGVVSAPSSSIIWPLMLGPGAGTAWHVYVPLILNLIGALFAAALLPDILARIVGPHPRVSIALACLTALALNLPGLVLTGMEHSWQIFLTLAIVLGLIKTGEGANPELATTRLRQEKSKPQSWLWLAIFLAPLFRYESAMASFAALAILFHRGHRRDAILCGLAILAAIGAFTAFLLANGLDAIPSSTIVKKLRLGYDYWPFWWRTFSLTLLISPISQAMALFIFAAGPWCLKNWDWKNDRWFGTGILAGFLAAHFLLGRSTGWDIPRYEIYAFAFFALYGAWLWRAELTALWKKPAGFGLLYFALIMLAAQGVYSSVFATPAAERAIYLQQYQMGRLVHEFWKKPIGANDIGIVGFQNPNLVLDLVGLSDRNARLARWSKDITALDRYVRTQPVDLLMLYRSWFFLPIRKNWLPIGELFRDERTTLGDRSVLFLTPYPEKAESIRAVLREWAKTLPEGATFTIYDEKNPAPESGN